ncbi:hypothetical protein C0J52_18981 [Blattella germanica]|nr:hypothetical protein C0J52_18981 [Blattella germanica]
MQRLFDGFSSLPTHTPYFLLKNCLFIPKLTYILRTSPLWLFPALIDEIDSLIRICPEPILNLHLEDNNWILATLPTSLGGLGVRRITDVCVSAFLASSYGVRDFIQSNISPYGDEIVVLHLNAALKEWSIITCSTRLLAVRTKESGLWLSTVPSANIGTLMDNMTFKIAVALRVGAKFCFPHKCICGVNVDPHGYQGLSCPKNTGRFSRHFQLDVIQRALVSAGFPSIREPVARIVIPFLMASIAFLTLSELTVTKEEQNYLKFHSIKCKTSSKRSSIAHCENIRLKALTEFLFVNISTYSMGSGKKSNAFMLLSQSRSTGPKQIFVRNSTFNNGSLSLSFNYDLLMIATEYAYAHSSINLVQV